MGIFSFQLVISQPCLFHDSINYWTNITNYFSLSTNLYSYFTKYFSWHSEILLILQRLSTATALWKSSRDPPVKQIWKITVEGSGRDEKDQHV